MSTNTFQPAGGLNDRANFEVINNLLSLNSSSSSSTSTMLTTTTPPPATTTPAPSLPIKKKRGRPRKTATDENSATTAGLPRQTKQRRVTGDNDVFSSAEREKQQMLMHCQLTITAVENETAKKMLHESQQNSQLIKTIYDEHIKQIQANHKEYSASLTTACSSFAMAQAKYANDVETLTAVVNDLKTKSKKDKKELARSKMVMEEKDKQLREAKKKIEEMVDQIAELEASVAYYRSDHTDQLKQQREIVAGLRGKVESLIGTTATSQNADKQPRTLNEYGRHENEEEKDKNEDREEKNEEQKSGDPFFQFSFQHSGGRKSLSSSRTAATDLFLGEGVNSKTRTLAASKMRTSEGSICSTVPVCVICMGCANKSDWETKCRNCNLCWNKTKNVHVCVRDQSEAATFDEYVERWSKTAF
jgi:hypothetical protein